MKIPIIFACLVILFTSGKPQEIQDDYSTHLITKVLEQPTGYSASFLEKQTNRLGDRVSIALLKIFDPEEFSKPETVRKILPLMHDAFVAPKIISITEDRKPKVTLFLLTYLQHQVGTPELSQQISQTIEFVRQKAAEK